jgi:hypothetical protein
MRAIVSPLLTSDDLSLRTTIASPDLYDQELSHLMRYIKKLEIKLIKGEYPK